MELLLIVNLAWLMFIVMLPMIISVRDVEPKNNTSYVRLAGDDGKRKPFRLLIRAYHNFKLFYVRSLVVRMRYSVNARKFYCLLTFIVMLVTHFLDYILNNSLRDSVAALRSAGADDVDIAVAVSCYTDYMTPDVIQLISALVIMVFFFYRVADRLLTFISNNGSVFLGTVLMTGVLAVMPERCMLLAETMFIILAASLSYPDYRPTNTEPKGGIKIFDIFRRLKVA